MMKTWLRKSLVVLISILTFGTVTPSHAFWNSNEEITKAQQRGTSTNEAPRTVAVEAEISIDQIDHKTQFVETLKYEAQRQSIYKFGPKITRVIEDEFRSIILPNIEAAIEMTAAQFPEDELMNLSISESPSGGVSEKIFHIYRTDTNEDIIRFHVRRDKPPLDGYYFDFHYHTHHDKFQTHYSLGTIYWDKNTPPNWQAI